MLLSRFGVRRNARITRGFPRVGRNFGEADAIHIQAYNTSTSLPVGIDQLPRNTDRRSAQPQPVILQPISLTYCVCVHQSDASRRSLLRRPRRHRPGCPPHRWIPNPPVILLRDDRVLHDVHPAGSLLDKVVRPLVQEHAVGISVCRRKHITNLIISAYPFVGSVHSKITVSLITYHF